MFKNYENILYNDTEIYYIYNISTKYLIHISGILIKIIKDVKDDNNFFWDIGNVSLKV